MIITVTPNISLDKTLIVEDFKIGHTHRVKEEMSVPGGKGLNASRALSGMGYKATIIGFIGGNIGKYIQNELEYEGLPYDLVEIKGESRTCYNVVDPINHTQTEILEKGPLVVEDYIKLLEDTISKYLSKETVVCMGGSLPLGAPVDLYVRLVEFVKKSGAKVILDTSGEPLKAGIKGRPYAVKPNRTETEAIVGFKLTTIEYMKKALDYFVRAGIELPVISMGKDGSIFYSEGSYYKVTPPVLEALNAVGSGDSVVAGIALGLEKKLSIIESVRLGAAMGTANVLTLRPGDVRKDDVERILPKVEVTSI
jgi:tagatose 6-phosphate kinase